MLKMINYLYKNNEGLNKYKNKKDIFNRKQNVEQSILDNCLSISFIKLLLKQTFSSNFASKKLLLDLCL